jgi:hypothetical protein
MPEKDRIFGLLKFKTGAEPKAHYPFPDADDTVILEFVNRKDGSKHFKAFRLIGSFVYTVDMNTGKVYADKYDELEGIGAAFTMKPEAFTSFQEFAKSIGWNS